MAQRFTDTEIWRKPWYRALSPAEREAWRYILDTCDSVGVWYYDPYGVEFAVGVKVDLEDLVAKVNGNIEVLEPKKKWWIKDFCAFQYAEIKEGTASKPLLSFMSSLKRHGLWERYRKGMEGVQEKEKEKEKEKEEEKERKRLENLLRSKDPRAKAIRHSLGGIARGIVGDK